MTNSIKTAFDGIRAEEALKESTLRYLHGELQRRHGARIRRRVGRFALAFASLVLVCCSGMLSHALYFTPRAYIDVDVNPSIELTLNRFDRVIDTRAHNGDGEVVLAGLSLTHKSYSDALLLLIEAMNQNGYMQGDGLVSVTLQTGDAAKENRLLADIQTEIADYMVSHHHTAQLDVFPVGDDTRSNACEQGVSPAKYLAIQALIEVDPTASVENCREHSILEIRQMAQEHGAHHAGGNSAGDGQGASGSASHEDKGSLHESASTGSTQSKGHNGMATNTGQSGGHGGKSGGRHGGHG